MSAKDYSYAARTIRTSLGLSLMDLNAQKIGNREGGRVASSAQQKRIYQQKVGEAEVTPTKKDAEKTGGLKEKEGLEK